MPCHTFSLYFYAHVARDTHTKASTDQFVAVDVLDLFIYSMYPLCMPEAHAMPETIESFDGPSQLVKKIYKDFVYACISGNLRIEQTRKCVTEDSLNPNKALEQRQLLSQLLLELFIALLPLRIIAWKPANNEIDRDRNATPLQGCMHNQTKCHPGARLVDWFATPEALEHHKLEKQDCEHESQELKRKRGRLETLHKRIPFGVLGKTNGHLLKLLLASFQGEVVKSKEYINYVF